MTERIDRNTTEEIVVTERRKRTPITERRILYIPDHIKDPAYVYRWVNSSQQGRVQYMKSRDWEVVAASTLEKPVGDARVNKSISKDSTYSVTFGSSTLILMRILKEYYNEDKAAMQKEIDKKERDLKRSLRKSTNPDESGFYGEVKIN